MQFRILGPLQVLDGGRELRLGPAKEQAVLGVLLLNPGSVVSRTQLIEGLWGERPPQTAAKAVNVYVSQVRKTLSVNGVDPIVTRSPGYALEVEDDGLDSALFQRVAGTAREREEAGEIEAAAALMREALALWRGPALAGIELEGEGRDEVARLDELRLAAQLDLIDYDLTLGRHEQLLAELEPLVAQQPFDERLRGQVILALYRSGRQADALQAYRETRETLVETLGIEPSAPLQRLERAILNQDPALEAPAGTARPVAPASRTRRGRRAAAVVSVGAAAMCAVAAYIVFAQQSHHLRIAANSVGLIAGGDAENVLTFSASSRPAALAFDKGSLWLSTGTGELVRGDLAHSGEASSFPSNGRPGPIAIFAGSVWALDSDRGVVEQIDPSTGRVVRSITVGNGPTSIAAGFGALWITNEADGSLSRVDPATGAVKTIASGQNPDGVAVGDGSVWVSDAASGVVLRFEPEHDTLLDMIAVGRAPGALAFGHGAVWVANRDDGTISRIDPALNRVSAGIPIGRSADGVAVADGSAWAISTADGTITRIDLATNRTTTSKLGSAPALIASSGRRLAVATVATSTSHRGGTLRLVGGDETATLDPATWWTTMGWGVLAVTNDGLLTVRRSSGPSGLQIVPDLARSTPVVAPDRTSYTFQLRTGIRYSDGRPVRARDVRASIERVWKLRFPGLNAAPDVRLGLVGEAACASRPGRCDLARGIVTDDATGTVTFRLARRNPQFERLLALPFYDVLPAGTPARDGRPLPATGPYRLTHVVPGSVVELERNPRFHPWSTAAQPPGYPDRIVWRLGGSTNSALRSVRLGRSDYAVLGEALGTVPAATPRGRVQVENEPFPALLYAFLNTHVPPFDHVAARRALNLAADRRIVARLAGGPLAVRPTCQILPPSFPGYRPWCPYSFEPNASGSWIAPDLRAAHELVRKSGTLGSSVVVWTMRDPSEPERLAIGRYITGLLRTLGYRARLRALPKDSYYGYVADSRHRAQIGLAVWVPDVLSPSRFFDPLLTCRAYKPASPDNANLAGYCDARTDSEVRRAQRLEVTAPATASAVWGEVDRRVVDAAPWIPLYNVRSTDVLSSRVGNYQHNPMLGFLIDQAWVK